MLTRIIFGFILFSSLVSAQYSAVYGNLIRIPFDANQVNPSDTMGNWLSYSDSNGYINSNYTDIIHTPQSTLFEKHKEQDVTSFGLTTLLSLENFVNATSESYGWWVGYYDVPEPYIIYNTVPFRVENGTWLMNGVYNMSFISDNDEISILPRNYYGDLDYIAGKVNEKYLTVFKKDTFETAYDFYLLDLSNSPNFDTTNAEKIYFEIPVAPYEIIHLDDSLYIAGVDSLPYMGYGIYLFQLENNTFHFVKQFFNSFDQYWAYRNGFLYLYDYPDLVKYEYNPADTSFINETVIVAGGGLTINDDFTFATQFSGDSLLIYNINTGQLINTIDISRLWNPRNALIDSPYVYLHQTTMVTDVKEDNQIPLSYNLQVYPNPFNPSTNVIYTLPEKSNVKINLFDMLGREVKNLYDGESEAGNHKLLINASDLASGIYFIRLETGDHFKTQKILLLK